KREYNLEDRTVQFSGELITFCKAWQKNVITLPLINQLIRSGTSIGANYREANGGSSKKDFQNKIFICKKEAKETLYWLELIGKSVDEEKQRQKARELWQETKELTLIFSKIAHSTKN
ncbi:MAG: four helix bundle protein, partial [Patescibacteria group bacterium]